MSNLLTIFGGNKLGVEIKSTKIMKLNTNGDLIETTPCVLIDTSQSMSERDCPDKKRRIDIVNIISKKINGLPMFSFSDKIYPIKFFGFLKPNGSTDLTNALNNISKKHYPKIILISDGCPNEPEESIEKAISMNIIFDTIYIGKDYDGKNFMRTIAEKTGGQFKVVETTDLCFQEKLESGIEIFLLSDGK